MTLSVPRALLSTFLLVAVFCVFAAAQQPAQDQPAAPPSAQAAASQDQTAAPASADTPQPSPAPPAVTSPTPSSPVGPDQTPAQPSAQPLGAIHGLAKSG